MNAGQRAAGGTAEDGGAPPLLEMRGITKDFPGIRALDHVDFSVHPGEVHALVGENGAGKSTLIRILGGVIPSARFSGELRLRGTPVAFHSVRDAERAGIAIIHQELMLVDQMSVAENLFLGDEPARLGLVRKGRMLRAAQELVDGMGLDVSVRAPAGTIGMARRQMLEIARALRKKARILVLDEPTSALADQEVERIFTILRDLRAQGVAIIYISHRLEEVFGLADSITVLRDGRSVDTRPAAGWTREALVSAMVGRTLREFFPHVQTAPLTPVLEVEGLSVEDPDRRGRMLLQDVSFTVRKGEIVGLAGLMGAGRTELLSTLFGAPPGRIRGGRVRVNGIEVELSSPADAIRHAVAFVPEDRKSLGLVMELSVRENLSLVHLRRFSRAGLINRQAERQACADLSRRILLRAGALGAPAGVLSGGNQQKVVLGKWLMQAPALFFLDEPTRGVDVGAKVEIYTLMNELKAGGAGILMASSELPEVLGMSDRIVVLRRGQVSVELAREEATQERIMEHAA